MPNIRPLLPNQRSNRPGIPTNFHSQRRTHKPKTKRRNSSPSKGQQLRSSPRIKIITFPTSATENQVLFCYDGYVDDGPVTYYAEEGL